MKMDLTDEQSIELGLYIAEKLQKIGNTKSENLIKEIKELYPVAKEELKTNSKTKRNTFFLLCAEGARMMAEYTALQDIKKTYNVSTIDEENN